MKAAPVVMLDDRPWNHDVAWALTKVRDGEPLPPQAVEAIRAAIDRMREKGADDAKRD